MLEESSAILEELGDRYLFVNVLISRGIVALIRGDYPDAHRHFDRGLAFAREVGDRWGMADALTNLGCVLRIQGDYVAARTRFEEAFLLYQEGGRGIWCTDPLCALAENEMAQGKLPAARQHLQKASASAEASENKWLQVLVDYFQGLLAFYEGDTDRAASLLETAMAVTQESQYKPDWARSLVTLGRVQRALGETARAATLLHEGLGVFCQIHSKLGIATALEGLAGIAVSGDAEQAARLFGAAEAIRDTIGAPLPPVDRPAYERDVAALRTHLDNQAVARRWAEGRALTCEQIISLLD
jgi:tetratricopeptide (TPR) repeat protein